MALFILQCTKTHLRHCHKAVTTSSTRDKKEPATGCAAIPYIQGVTEPIQRILNSLNVKVAQKPFETLWHYILPIFIFTANDCYRYYFGREIAVFCSLSS